ncbi:MAG: DUF2480 family protein [Flavobacteriia bacterium]|nr:DUF2480 family protein [Flavobacteriia bacterium]
MEEIINKVKDSGLISLDLGKFNPKDEIIGIDLAEQLWQGLVLKEKDFRNWIKENNWSQFENKAVYIHCSVDALIPTWAYMLVASTINNIAETYIVGTKIDLQKKLIQKEISKEPLEKYHDGRVIVKGCSDIPAVDFAMVTLIQHLQPVVKSIMYGEPCSTVPVYKRK